jgi:hypothetical protein
MNNPNRGIINNKVLDGIAWGSFFILVGSCLAPFNHDRY